MGLKGCKMCLKSCSFKDISDNAAVVANQENHGKPSHTREELLQDNSSELLINILDKGREDGGGGKLASSDVMRRLR